MPLTGDEERALPDARSEGGPQVGARYSRAAMDGVGDPDGYRVEFH